MQLAEDSQEMSFQKIQEELQLKAEEVEPFIIDGKHNKYFSSLKLKEHKQTPIKLLSVLPPL